MMFVRLSPLSLVIGAVLLLAAGRSDLPALWAYPFTLWLLAGGIYTLLQRKNPDLVRERLGAQPDDRERATRRIALPLALAHYAVAGLDGRFGWSTVPPALQLAGFGLVVAGLAMVGWTLLSNPYASSAVRIQSERKQTVISTGPYALVRHPMYLGVFLFGLGSGLALGSWWSALFGAPLLAVFVRRTLIEDRMLHAELEGYPDYAARVRSRVIPGVF